MLDGIVRETMRALPRAPDGEFGRPRRQKLQTGPYGEKFQRSGANSEFFNTISPELRMLQYERMSAIREIVANPRRKLFG